MCCDEKIPGHSQLFSWAKTIDMKESEMQRPRFFFFSLRDHSFLRLRYYEGEFRPLFMFRKKVSCKQFIFKLKLSYQNKTYIASKKPNVPLHSFISEKPEIKFTFYHFASMHTNGRMTCKNVKNCIGWRL